MERVFGNYTLNERIGIGGMGEVFRATKRGPDGFEVQVALKLILPDLAKDDSFRERFKREARLAGRLSHPNIVRVHGFDILDDKPFIEMEYVHGMNLASLLKGLPPGETLPFDEAVCVIYNVARGLDYAHSLDMGGGAAGLIHRDLNPHNILISGEGEVKIVDFGIARAAMAEPSASATLMGKLAFMSPEQVEGRPLDHRTDLFSLGTTAYLVLCGTHPFQRGSEAATLRAVQGGEHRPILEAAPHLPEPAAGTVEALLKVLPEDRPVSSSAVADTFREFLKPAAPLHLGDRVGSMERSAPGPVTAVPTAPTLVRQWRAGRLAKQVLMIIAAVLLVAGTAILRYGPEEQEPDPAVKPARGERTAEVAAPVAEKPAEDAMVTVQSDPEGAEILADGVPLGKAPVQISAGPGGRMPLLEARLAGYAARKFGITHDAGGRYTVRLSPLPTGTVSINAKPWARVTFEGVDLGETPIIDRKVPVGKHTFTLTNDSMSVVHEVSLDVAEGSNSYTVDMTKPGR